MSEIIETSEDKRKESECSDTEYDPQYKPIITLPEVEVSTNEENEVVFLKIRAKLYRFDSHNDPPEWKERGTGELKILRHKDNNSMRIVMRRDKTLKVCANHFITPWMELKPSAGSEKAFVYTVLADFADEKPKSECLAVRFGTTENANLFKDTFEDAKKVLLKDCSLYNGKCDEENEDDAEGKLLLKSFGGGESDEETSEVTGKLSELTTGDTAKKE